MGKPRLRKVKKGGRVPGAAKGIFKKAGGLLKTPKRLPAHVRAPHGPRVPPTHKPFLRRPDRIPGDAAPYRAEYADRVPPYGTKGAKTTGVADLGGERVVGPIDSGMAGPATQLPKPRRGMDGNVVSHVEAHTVAHMRQNGVKEATLYINQVPCSYSGPRGRPSGCDIALERMLLPGEKLTVYGPNGFVKVYTGKP